MPLILDRLYPIYSDMGWGYFISYYHLATRPVFKKTMVYGSRARPRSASKEEDSVLLRSLHNRMVAYNKTSNTKLFLVGSEAGQCLHGSDYEKVAGDGNCTVDAHVCHRITPKHMQVLHASNRKLFPNHYD